MWKEEGKKEKEMEKKEKASTNVCGREKQHLSPIVSKQKEKTYFKKICKYMYLTYII